MIRARVRWSIRCPPARARAHRAWYATRAVHGDCHSLAAVFDVSERPVSARRVPSGGRCRLRPGTPRRASASASVRGRRAWRTHAGCPGATKSRLVAVRRVSNRLAGPELDAAVGRSVASVRPGVTLTHESSITATVGRSCPSEHSQYHDDTRESERYNPAWCGSALATVMARYPADRSHCWKRRDSPVTVSGSDASHAADGSQSSANA